MKLLVIGQGEMAEALLTGVRSSQLVVEPFYFVRKNTRRYTNIKLPFGLINHSKSIDYINQLDPDYILLASWPEIIKPDTLEKLQVPVINCHPSLLPKYRGPNPYYAMVLMQEKQSGLTFHLVDTGIDTGPIILQSLPFNIEPTDTWMTLRHKTINAMSKILPTLLEQLQQSAGQLQGLPQNNLLSSYFPHATENDFWIDWGLSAERLARQCLAQQKLYPLITRFRGMKILFQWGEMVSAYSCHVNQTLFDMAVPGQIIKSGLNQFWVKTEDPSKVLKLFRPKIHDMPDWQAAILSPLFFRPGQCFG